MLKVNYSNLCNKSVDQIRKELNKRGIRYDYPSTSISDLIGMIIAHDAYYEGRNDVMRGIAKPTNDRKKYRIFTEDNETYYLNLTKEQGKLLVYLIDNGVRLYNTEYEIIDDVEYVSP